MVQNNWITIDYELRKPLIWWLKFLKLSKTYLLIGEKIKC